MPFYCDLGYVGLRATEMPLKQVLFAERLLTTRGILGLLR